MHKRETRVNQLNGLLQGSPGWCGDLQAPSSYVRIGVQIHALRTLRLLQFRL